MKKLATILVMASVMSLGLFGQKTDAKKILANDETKTEIFNLILGDHALMTEFMTAMEGSEHAMMMMKSGNMMNHEGMQNMEGNHDMMKGMDSCKMMENMEGMEGCKMMENHDGMGAKNGGMMKGHTNMKGAMMKGQANTTGDDTKKSNTLLKAVGNSHKH